MYKVISLLLILVCFACHEASKRGTFPETPVNLTEINSAYDDYNSNIPEIYVYPFPLIFSSNRKSSGANFDLVYYFTEMHSSKETGRVMVNVTNGSLDKIDNALYKLNSAGDEFGPYLVSPGEAKVSIGYEPQSYLFLYSSNEGGNQDIKFLHNLDDESYSNPLAIAFLNSPQEDAYPCITADSSALYFCSNRKGDFTIYKAILNKGITIRQNLEDTSPKDIVEITSLSSSADDKCPLIVNDVMVFVSNRLGGFGGFDLYYSILKNDEWSTPINFGDKINTKFDEYRPFIKPMGTDFTNDFMIFSSNRPGGNGGFDLYYVGVPKLEQFQ